MQIFTVFIDNIREGVFHRILKKDDFHGKNIKVLHVQQLLNNFCSISMRAMICAIISRKVLFENRGNSIIAKYQLF